MKPVTHILYLIEDADLPPFSGAENHLFILLRALHDRQIPIELLILLGHSGPRIEAKIAELRMVGISVHIIPCASILDRSAIIAVRRFLVGRRHHIIHTHLDRADILGKIGAFFAGCSYIISTTHNHEMHHLRPKWYLLIHLLDLVTRRYIAISESVKDFMVRSEQLPERKISVVPYGVPLPNDIQEKSTLRIALDLPQDKFIIGFVGRLTDQKNIPLLLKAINSLSIELPDLFCVIVGTGELAEPLRALASKETLNNIRFLGAIEGASNLMPAFDVFCLPSKWEGLGLVLIEAMQRRVPIIGSSAGAIPEVLDQGQAGLVFKSDNLADLCNAIRSLYYQPSLREQFTDYAYRHVVEAYTVDQMVAKTLSVYKAL